MDRIGTRTLRADLANHLRRAGDGERLIITVDGQPIAQLGPLGETDDPTIDDLVARGQLRRARRDDRPEPAVTLPLWAGTRIDQLVREVRGR